MVDLKHILITLTLVATVGHACASEFKDSDPLLSNPVVQQLMERLSVLEAQDKIQQHRITELESHDLAQQKLISHLEDVVRHQQKQVEEVKSSPPEISQNNVQLKKVPTAKAEVINENEIREHSKAEANRIRRQQQNVDTVAFTAVLYTTRSNLGADQNVVFDHVETNIGNAYNEHLGVFIAPISGTYVFHVTVLSVWNTETWCTIVVNGVRKVGVYAYGDPNHHDQGSQMLVVRLNQGDDVAIQNAHADNFVFGDRNTYTAFSGFLLR